MHSRIELYINGQRADLDEKGLLLYNYAFTDLQTPTAVKNSFSKQITLPATPRNLAIFGQPQRTDRSTWPGGGMGIMFNPQRKTPFLLMDEAGQILESGYLRLDSTTTKGRVVTGLKISLFGGIGSFFYELSYNADGTKKTLADLDYGEVDLSGTFDITAAWVQECWQRLADHAQADGIENAKDIINYAPAYNGIPEGDFDANKMLVKPAEVGLDAEITEDDTRYSTQNGYSIVSLKDKHDEWACKDLRCYLQRPVYSMRAFLEAIARPASNGGYAVDFSQVPTSLYYGLWKTLPMLADIGGAQEVTGTKQMVWNGGVGISSQCGPFDIDPIPMNATASAALALKLRGWFLQGSATPPAEDPVMTAQGSGFTAYIGFFTQLVGFSNGVPVCASDVQCITTYAGHTSEEIAEEIGYTPALGKSIGGSRSATPKYDAATQSYYIQESFSFSIADGAVATSYSVVVRGFSVVLTGSGTVFLGRDFSFLFSDGQIYPVDAIRPVVGEYSGSVSYTATEKIRSGATLAYKDLLNSAHTPAEYLISFCKQNGLVFRYDNATKAVTILPRNAWFTGEITDLSARVDRSKEITIQPLAQKAKWYEMKGEIVKGAFAEEYEKKYGVSFGIQRVNTGYDFDAASEDVMKAVVFRSAVTKLDYGPYWNALLDGDDNNIPSVFIDTGSTYILWDADAKGKAFTVQDTAEWIMYYNPGFKGYDYARQAKLEFRTADGKPVDGTDVLCWYNGMRNYPFFKVTDDSLVMLALNNGKPCWDYTGRQEAGVDVPIFHRYNAIPALSPVVTRSLDYGTPREVEFPGITFSDTTGSTYLRSWKKYLADLLDKDTKVMKCRVDLGGLQVGPELLRRFYYYEGSIWVLNKITNYSLTTWDPTECEFVQVQDMSNYTNGQNL